jgi:hypothetical protein
VITIIRDEYHREPPMLNVVALAVFPPMHPEVAMMACFMYVFVRMKHL